eukprot:CAMPEP_0113317890 /NCGR_PEP_ID=MMETSP0010_2-20120614/12652_1 /TAXON_ID=216773 ORGANISM="Corethron hystrix, Strain 308" /NCGR_SAMPLE_ID=MMETSP0010_2 /ASSEMBLY_ACC=CAM_ASM_000155 /LENGTH=202 /DNA_ID=CAMNT_0000175031 /DNA_START=163 /DNA_END=771 /DNA_ORIENTATION=- /assembly_acc=CAM_ASM_000155
MIYCDETHPNSPPVFQLFAESSSGETVYTESSVSTGDPFTKKAKQQESSVPELISVDPDGIFPHKSLQTRKDGLTCDACPCCDDICDDPSCLACKRKCSNDRFASKSTKFRSISMCELRRHNKIDSAWLLVDGIIYNVTDYIKRHPGGTNSILKYTGGVKDCKDDMDFHSRKAMKLLKDLKIGKLSPCHGSSPPDFESCSIM